MTATQRQFGKYRLIRKIATGGMGEIFEARHVDQPESKPPVALKRILKHHCKDKRFVRMFFKEAKIITELDHPNLIRVQDFGKEQDQFYMTMEYIEGYNLDTVLTLARKTPSAWSIACGIEVVRQALAGIGYAHAKMDGENKPLNIVHLDLSPHNLMLDRKGQVKILDFGISKAIYEDDQKAFNALRGTYAYMSPEQCREQEVDARSDLFTLGVVLYELTTLAPLFSRQPSEFMILKAITEGLVPPPTNSIKDFPPELEKVLDIALKVNREERYESAGAFLSALDEVVAHCRYPGGPDILAQAMEGLTPVEPEQAASAGMSDAPPSTIQVDGAALAQEPEKAEKAEKSAAPQASVPVTDTPVPSSAASGVLAAADRDELSARLKGQRRSVWAGFALLLALILGGLGVAHQAKTGWLPASAGGTIYMPESGVLFVDSEPRGASVWLNQKPVNGKTPLHIRDLPLGAAQKVEVVFEGERRASESVTLTARKPLAGILLNAPN